jgi:cobaltochelatase CobN
VAAICFYRALVQSGQTAPVAALCEALADAGVNALPVFVSSLKDPVSVGTVEAIFAEAAPDVVINATGFAVSSPGGETKGTVLESTGAPVLQVVFAGGSREAWAGSQQGLTSRDLAMHVALPEVDGRVLSRAVSFKSAARYDEMVEANIVTHAPDPDRVAFVAELAARWARLRRTAPAERRVAIVLANYPNRDGRIANGVGLDTPAGTVEVLRAMEAAGYATGELPADGDALVAALKAGPTNALREERIGGVALALEDYRAFFAGLDASIQSAVTERWGAPEADPHVLRRDISPGVAAFWQCGCRASSRRAATTSIPKAPTTTGSGAAASLPRVLCLAARAVLTPMRSSTWASTAISNGCRARRWRCRDACYPEAVLGPVPHIYPFIVNDPGEGTQAKRRTSAVIIDHLTPPLTRAESYGPLKPIWNGWSTNITRPPGRPAPAEIAAREDPGPDTPDIGARPQGLRDRSGRCLTTKRSPSSMQWLCDLKEMQIRDGLHILRKVARRRIAD